MYVMISPFFQQRYSDINSDKIIWEYIISEAHFKPVIFLLLKTVSVQAD